MRLAVIVVAVSLGLSGCAAFTPPIEKPVIEDHVKKLGTLATTPERRVVLVDESGYFCAEPSPDTAQAISSSFSAAVKAAAKQGNDKEINASAELARSLSTSINNLFVRSQGIQLFRDGSYALCQAGHNNAITSQQYNDLLTDLIRKSSDLIKDELDIIQKSKDLNTLQEAQNAAAQAKDASGKAATSETNAKKSADSAAASATAAEKSAQEVKPK